MKKTGLIIAILFTAVITTVKAQNNTSAYSIVGIGDIESGYFDRSTGMANTGLSAASNRFMYHANPASYAKLDDYFFHVELSSRFKWVSYSGGTISASANNSSDLQIKKIALAIKVKKRWGASFGLLPFSNSNYSFYAPKQISGTPYTTQAYYEGTGSINQLYFANSFAVTKNFSVGLHSAFLFGHMEKKETVYAGYIDSSLITTINTYYTNPYFKLGLLYHAKVNSNLALGFGATGSVQTKLRSSESLLVQDGSTTAVSNDAYNNSYFKLPYMYGGGVSAVIKDKYTISTDYNFQSWSDQNIRGVGYSLTNSSRYSTGFEYSKKLRYRDLSFERYFLQAGFYYSQSYLILNTKQINDVGGTVGGGFNFNNGLGLQATLQFGNRGTISSGLIKENYAQFTLTFSYRDRWLTNVKRYD